MSKSIFFVISMSFLDILSSTPIKTPIDVNSLKAKDDECLLPQILDRYGTMKYLEDCESLLRFETVPVPVTPLGGNPRVCCPPVLGEEPICFESDAWCQTYKPADNDDYYYDYYDYPLKVDVSVSNLEFICQQTNTSTSCVPVSRCDIKSPQENLFCGMKNGENQVCCAGENILEQPATLPKPRYPDSNGNARQCEDKSNFCKKWVTNGICDLDTTEFTTGEFAGDPTVRGVDMYAFSLLACQDTCDLCADKGCIDEHEKCPQWAREGYCLTAHFFMGHTCRESCGQCGYLSSRSSEEQIRDGKSYTNILDQNFECGRFKSIEELVDNGLEVTLSEFSDKSIPDANDECPDAQTETVYDAVIDNSGAEAGELFDDIADGDYFDIRDSAANTGGNSSAVNCGLILISDRFMLTAAHCYDDLKTSRDVRATSIRSYLPQYQETFLQKKIFRHPGYQFPKLYNDIAVVELDRRVMFDYEVLGDTPSCLANDDSVGGSTAMIQGFGQTEEGDFGKRLGVVNTTLIDGDQCKDDILFQLSKLKRKRGKTRKLCEALESGPQEEHICGIGSPLCSKGQRIVTSACKGDSGGPVEIMIDNKRTVVGLVSGSLSCSSEIPEWYTKVGYYREWINCIIEQSQKRNPKGKVEEYCGRKFYTPKTDQKKLDICE